ncbi:MAG: DUF4080 domain-containing protein [Christensenellales bacterium]|jgi:radical SAM superfamily enzyme YgiQ (UPF0313 family)
MKTILLCALGARWSHSSLALPCLVKAAAGLPVRAAEYNINDSPDEVTERIISAGPDAVGFSCYIWNIGFVLTVASAVKKLMPGCTILLGGPEVSFDAPELMKRHRFIDIIIRGPGEAPFRRFAEAFCSGESIDDTPSACIRTPDGGVRETPDAAPMPMGELPFVYDDFTEYAGKIIYYETSRGCPFRCAYCLSARTVTDFLPEDRAIRELEYFMRHDVRQVKLVDRTFNYPDDRARRIFEALIALKEKYPQSRTNFHFEISASLLSDETLAVLVGAPPGLIQFEVGIQSTHGDTLRAVGRGHSTQAVLEKTARLCRMKNLHVHVDLIAGLPLETPETFAQSFDNAYRLGAYRLQLGFLKVLKGSPLRDMAGRYGIVYSDDAPYEVLQTSTMPYAALCRLHRVAALLDTLYNNRAAAKTLELLTSRTAPYDVFDGLAAYLEQRGYFERRQKPAVLMTYLYEYACGLPGADAVFLREALAYDWFSRQNAECPAEFAPEDDKEHRAFARQYFEKEAAGAGRRLQRGRIVNFSRLLGEPAYVLFDYAKKPGSPGFCTVIKPQ